MDHKGVVYSWNCIMYDNIDVFRTQLHSSLAAATKHASHYAADTFTVVSTHIKNVPLNIKVALGATAGCAAVGIIAYYLRRRRKRRKQWTHILEVTPANSVVNSGKDDKVSVASSNRSHRTRASHTPTPSSLPRHPSLSTMNGSLRGSVGDNFDVCIEDDQHSVSTVTLTHHEGENSVDPQQKCARAMEHVGQAIQQFQDVLHELMTWENFDGEPTSSTPRLYGQIHEYLEAAQQLQRLYERDHWEAYSASIALETTLQQLNTEYEEQRRRKRTSETSGSQAESFHSAISVLSVADLSKLHEEMGRRPQFPVFEQALIELEENHIPYRTIRTHMLGCKSDCEFLAKLHCLRPAFQIIFSDSATSMYFKDAGRRLLVEIMGKAGREWEEVEQAYNALIHFVEDPANTALMEEELSMRGVPMLTFYDVVIDFLILDAFDDLASPPSSVVSVCQNRWLSAGFKETALSTAVWSVLKAKRRMLKFPRGFVAHFYAVAEHTSPVFAWGFMGPDTSVKHLCQIFKNEVLGFLCDVFSFQHVRYTTYQTIADDVLNRAKQRLNSMLRQLALVQPVNQA